MPPAIEEEPRFPGTLRSFQILLLGTLAVFCVAALLTCVLRAATVKPDSWNLLLIVIGAFGGGSLLGFIYGMFGATQSERFSPVFTLFSGLLGGVTIADLSRNNSAINSGFELLATNSGLQPTGGGIIACTMVAFASLGFMLFYAYNALLLNRATNAILSEIKKAEDDDRLRSQNLLPGPDPTGGGVAPAQPADESTKAAAKEIVARPGAAHEGSAQKLLLDAKAFTALENPNLAEAAMRNALEKSPDDQAIKYALARLLLAQEHRQREAISLLKEVVAGPFPPEDAWKLLGYSLLWGGTTEARRESIKATEEYLKRRTDDPGAKLNLACAYAQLYASGEQDAKEKALLIVESLVAEYPQMKRRLHELRNDDFRSLKDDPRFQALLQ